MEENQKKRNYEKYLEGDQTMSWNQDPLSAGGYESPSFGQPDSQQSYEQPSYQQPVYQQSSYQQSSYQQTNPVASQAPFGGLEEPVSKGEWALSFLLMLIPCVGFIMPFVWAFSSSEKRSKANFFQVLLIAYAIIFVLYMLLGFMIGFFMPELIKAL